MAKNDFKVTYTFNIVIRICKNFLSFVGKHADF